MPVPTPAVHDRILGGNTGARIEYLTDRGDAYLVSTQGDRWSVPVEYLTLARPGVRGGAVADWAVSPTWTEWDQTDALPPLY